ncbi:hypothetical protein Thal_0821 [Thermocrinis albus DSM 14484]|uniref:Uncharacterized protein n=1 Tax=Thermocrinis albus (strain DSM 14484 / JCM 11386 / HI 11/12) TaxID=638303 RepID=D3SL24_THEAH|nr:hypothetical protein [Thermocrinis albus]ADC89454.1 hypothetical protein Thal_0821 [Thermocrinis albus DSM 14484]
MPYKLLWLLDSPHPHWVETTKDNLKLDFRESGFRQFVSLNSRYIITDAMLMFGLEYSLNREELIEVLNPIRLMVKVKPGSYLSISHHFLGAPFEVEGDDVLKEFLFSARKLLEKGGFSLDVLVVSHNPYLEDLVLENLNRIEGLNYRFYGARP